MGGYGDVKMIDKNGKRMDGRGPADLREISIETGVDAQVIQAYTLGLVEKLTSDNSSPE